MISRISSTGCQVDIYLDIHIYMCISDDVSDVSEICSNFLGNRPAQQGAKEMGTPCQRFVVRL